jgi:hypothetical protein
MSNFESEEPREMSADVLCRVCACTSEDLVPVFGEKGLELQLLDKIHTHLPIMVKYKLIHNIIYSNMFIPLLPIIHDVDRLA